MKNLWRSFFNYSAAERRGILALIILAAGLFALRLGLAIFQPGRPPGRVIVLPVTSADSPVVFPIAGEETGYRYEQEWDGRETIPRLQEKTGAERWREKGRSQYNQRSIEINRADTAAFESLPGIGPVLSRRIIRYRSLLGGFYSPGQLLEVYGLRDSVYMLFSHRLQVDTGAIRKLSLNGCTMDSMSRHPYIGRYLAKGIVQYREKIRIADPRELVRNGLAEEEDFSRIKWYVKP